MPIDRSRAGKRQSDVRIGTLLAFACLIAFHPGADASGALATPPQAQHAAAIAPDSTDRSRVPTAGLEFASPDVQYVGDWIERTGDNAGMPYIIIDKVNAKVYVMDVDGRLQGDAPALLGMAQGDGTVAGLGEKLSAVRPDQRITPAGRYVASLGRDLHGGDILWIDYGNAIALHRVVKGTPVERRAQRLQSETSLDNRISYGCINVPMEFYDTFVSPAFTSTSGVVYILPEMSPAREMFGPHAITSRALPAPRAGARLPASNAPVR